MLKKMVVLFLVVSSLSISISGQTIKPIEKLNFLIGNWELKSFVFNQKGEWAEGKVTSSNINQILDGVALAETAEIKIPNFTFTIDTTFSYDKFREIYRISIVDKQQGLMDIYEGSFKGKSLVLDNLRSGTSFPLANGQSLFSRITYSLTNKNSFTLFLDVSTDKGKNWSKYIKVIYKRKKN